MTKPTVTSARDVKIAPGTGLSEVDFFLRIRPKDITSASWTSLRATACVEDRYWAWAATQRLKNPKWISETDFWSRFDPAS